METMLHKGRVRIKRGKLKSFDELPFDVQQKYKTIKKSVNEILGGGIDIYVFGSYKHGFWDELSDFDYIINQPFNVKNIDLLVLERTGIKANAFPTHLKLSDILIP